MSDATLPPPRSSSAAPGIGDGNRSDSSGNDVDLNSSTSLPPSSSQEAREDGTDAPVSKVPGKQKRKRTSPGDQAILEAEYKLNPKPNKAARAVIMEKVDLNEKELQIWFQNRRQINRRKSRPLLPHELAAFGLRGMAALSSDPASAPTSDSSEGLKGAAVDSQDNVISQQGSIAPEFEGHESTGACVNSSREGAADLSNTTDTPQPHPASMLRTQSSPESLNTMVTPTPLNESVRKTFLSTPGYLANRWNTANNPSSTPLPIQFTPPTASNPTLPASCPERIGVSDSAPSSKVRLSMSLDGKAELVAGDLSPSREYPARPLSSGAVLPQYRIRGLHRSHSSISFNSLSRLPSTNNPLIPRLPRGRSRDARNWEFFCDSEARDELTTQAEHESNGSAVAAISLLRSASNSALKSSSNKRNAPLSRQDLGSDEKRPKLGRAMSSLAKLQGTSKPSLKPSQSRSNKPKPGLRGSPSGDSDKENWIPEEGGNARRRPLPSSRPDRQSQSQSVLGDNHRIPTQAVNFGGNNKRRKAAHLEPHIFEDQESGETGKDVERFMRGEVSPSKKGDLDCIQGLLSLSQGNWR